MKMPASGFFHVCHKQGFGGFCSPVACSPSVTLQILLLTIRLERLGQKVLLGIIQFCVCRRFAPHFLLILSQTNFVGNKHILVASGLCSSRVREVCRPRPKVADSNWVFYEFFVGHFHGCLLKQPLFTTCKALLICEEVRKDAFTTRNH